MENASAVAVASLSLELTAVCAGRRRRRCRCASPSLSHCPIAVVVVGALYTSVLSLLVVGSSGRRVWSETGRWRVHVRSAFGIKRTIPITTDQLDMVLVK